MRLPQNNIQDKINTLKNLLENSGILTAEWGKGQAKTLEHLANEINNGETVLLQDSNYGLMRKVVLCSADIYYETKEGKTFRACPIHSCRLK